MHLHDLYLGTLVLEHHEVRIITCFSLTVVVLALTLHLLFPLKRNQPLLVCHLQSLRLRTMDHPNSAHFARSVLVSQDQIHLV